MSELIDAIRDAIEETLRDVLALEDSSEVRAAQASVRILSNTVKAIVAAREPVDSQVRFVSVRDDGDIRPMTLAKSRDACEMLCSLGGVPVESIQQVRITKEQK